MNLRKLLSVVVPAVVIIAALIYWFKKTPHFNGPLANVKLATWEFNHAKNNADRSRIALFQSSIVDYDIVLKQVDEEPDSLTPKEVETLSKMSAFRNQINETVAKLFASLTSEDIQMVTKDNPTSIYNLLNTFVLPPAQAPKCTEEDVQKITNTVGIEPMLDHGEELVSFAWVREVDYSVGYFSQLRNLLSKDSRFTEYKSLEQNYFQFASGDPDLTLQLRKLFGTNSADALKRLKSKLLSAEKTDQDLEHEIYKIAQNSPSCFVNFAEFYDVYRIWRTKIIGQKLWSNLNGTRKTSAKSGPLANLLRDAWMRKFEVEKSPSGLTIRSLGADGVKSDDDIVITHGSSAKP
jgi:hypothetical protein